MRRLLAVSFALAVSACGSSPGGVGGTGDGGLDGSSAAGGFGGLGGSGATGGVAGSSSGGSAGAVTGGSGGAAGAGASGGTSSGGAAGAGGGIGGAGTGGTAGSGATGGTGGTGGTGPIICNNTSTCVAALGGDACKVNIACDTSTATCKFDILDSDKDGHPPKVCGGDDCDDAKAAAHPGASEVCDEIDNNCNGLVDEGLNCPKCTPGAILFLLDRSGSMSSNLASGGTRWAALKTAVTSFAQNSASNVLSVGITYFPNSATDCNAASYTTPSVGIAQLPGAVSAIQTSLASTFESGSSILTAPITGGVSHLSTYAASNPTKPIGLVIITDGIPNTCTPGDTVANAAAAAASGLASSAKIKTYVLSLGADQNQSDWTSIAVAGGTTSAYNTGDSGGSTALTTALNAIRTDLTQCP